MAGLPGDGEVIEKSRLRRDLAIAGIAVVTLGVIVGLNFEEVVDGLSQITFAEAFGLVSLHLLALVLRAIAWGLCLDAAGSRVPPRELHATSGPRFLADTVVPTYVGAWVRIGLLKVMMGPRAPTIGQMISADGVILLGRGRDHGRGRGRLDVRRRPAVVVVRHGDRARRARARSSPSG